MPKTLDITLAIPLYNSFECLPKLFQALESQTFMPAEIIFLDDASPDRSIDLVNQFLQKHSELTISVYKNEHNLGIAGTYNRLIQLAKEKWIQILDADDFLIDDFYASIERHREEGVVAIVAGMRSNVCSISLINRLFSRFIPADLPKWLPMLGSFATRSGVVYATQLLKEHNFIDPVFDGSDILHFFDFRQLGKCIYEPRALIHYNVHPGAYSSKQADSKYFEALKKRSDIPIFYRLDFFLRKKMFSFLRRS